LSAATEEQLAIREVFAEFARREVLPGAAERDRTGAFPADLVRRIGELDGMGISVAEADGGLGLDTVAQLHAIEQIAYADAALASVHTAHYLGLEVFRLGAEGAERTRWLPSLARGELLAGFALTEPEAGSDIASMRTTARRDGEEWVLSGSKTFISNAAEAGVLALFATTDPSSGFRGISAFAVPAGTPGVSFSPPQEKLGLRSSPTYTVFLDDVRLPATALIGTPGRGGALALEVLNAARIDIAAMANGIALRAFDLARAFAADRRQFGRPIADFQAIQLLLGQMDAELQAARLTAWWAAEQRDQGGDLRRAGSIAKYLATETCFRVVDSALQVHGGAGYMRESEIERLYRDCRVLRIYEGTSQIQLLTIARGLTA
jgi:acyl-CoA dehydrogenase